MEPERNHSSSSPGTISSILSKASDVASALFSGIALYRYPSSFAMITASPLSLPVQIMPRLPEAKLNCSASLKLSGSFSIISTGFWNFTVRELLSNRHL